MTFRMRRCLAQALVETALVFPLLVVVSLGGLQVVLYAHAWTVLVSAVQEGARVAAQDGSAPEDGLARAHSLITAGLGTSVDPVNLVVSSDVDNVTVTASGAMRPLIALAPVDTLPVRAEGRLNRERFRPGGGA
ncbi:MAG: hypothetical protein NVSMB2_12390 [Chloroflexota bacterium]